ncbi:MAG TPA: molybdopterin-dependent oxidoreductase [Planctomycetaceae bacterium]|jgi:DMSO/TMAO reductase YedYZ molybdopterin-dependent catalytic subunit|nr:molybdopterin-dependent oxidoreductase [Planctomycetaceae bacterium]
MRDLPPFLTEHRALTRRFFLGVGLSSLALLGRPRFASAASPPSKKRVERQERFATYLTHPDGFEDVSRGKPIPHTLAEDRKRAVGLTRETWKLEVLSDPEHPVRLGKPLTKSDGTAIDFPALMKLAETRAVRFPKIMTCLNLGCPLGMGLWEGVPLRELVWMTEPHEDLRRVFYYGYHNDQPKQMFRSSLPIGRVLEDYFDLPPVILCYKLNGQWLTPRRGGPVRIVVPEHYGFKSIKWLSHVVLTSLPHANDTYADQGNDVDSPMKTFAATLSYPDVARAGEKIPLSGYAQVGVGGLSKVQILIGPEDDEPPADDPYLTKAAWRDVEILPPPAPKSWGGGLPGDRLPLPIQGFHPTTGRPSTWPMKLACAHWAGVHPGLPTGRYALRVRAIDERGRAQPLPRPFAKSGRAVIESLAFAVR